MYLVMNVGCICCGVSSKIVGVFDSKEKAESVAEKCRNRFSWREQGQNAFEVHEIPALNCVDEEYQGVKS